MQKNKSKNRKKEEKEREEQEMVNEEDLEKAAFTEI